MTEAIFECPVIGCDRSHRIEHVMCGRCWKSVARDLRKAVYRTWERRKRFPGDARAIAEHEDAKARAIASVERRNERRREAQ